MRRPPGGPSAPLAGDGRADGADASLIRRSLTDGEAFGGVFDRHADAIHRYLSRRVGADIADDLTGETFLVAFDRRERYDTAYADALPWLYGIATKLLGRHRRTEARRWRAWARTGTDPVQECHADAVSARVTAQSASREMAGALAGLPAGQRDVLLLVAWQGSGVRGGRQGLGRPHRHRALPAVPRPRASEENPRPRRPHHDHGGMTMDDLDALRGLRDDLPALSPLARSRARVKLMNHAAGERPGRAGLFSRPSMRIGLTAATAAAAVAAVGIFGGSGSPGTSGVTSAPASASAAPHTAGATPASVHVKEVAWSVDTARGGDVRLSMASYWGKGLGVKARTFERTLVRAGVPATLRSGVVCWQNGSALQKRVVSFTPVGEAYTVHTRQMPPGSRIVIGYQALPMGGLEWSIAVQAAGYPLHCEKVPDPHWTPQPGWTAPTDDPAHNSKTVDGPNATQ